MNPEGEGIPAAGAPLAEVLRGLREEVRRQFPARERDITGGRRVYLNSAGGTLVVERSARAMEETALRANAQDGAIGNGERATAEIHARARRGAAAFLNAPSPEEISFHQSTSHALFNLSFAFRDLLGRGSNLVVTRLDHAANVTPWESIWGEDCGLEVRQCGVRRDGTLDLDELAQLVDRRTRLIAVTCASNGLGTLVPVDEVVRIARRHGTPEPPSGAARQTRGRWSGALVVVDAVHHACHGPLDVRAMGCDFLAFSGYKIFGPMVGVLWGRKRWLDALRPYRVEANENRTPVKFEQGTPNHVVLAGLSAAFDYLEALGGRVESEAAGRAGLRAFASRLQELYPDRERRRLKWAMCAVRDYEQTLTKAVLLGFSALAKRGVRLHGLADEARAAERDPTFLFEVRGRTQMEIKKRLWEEGRIEVPDGNYYSLAVYRHLKSRRTVRASFAHYDGLDTVQHFLDTLARVAEG